MRGLIKGKEVHFDEDYLYVKLEDNRIISTPLNRHREYARNLTKKCCLSLSPKMEI